MKQQILLSTFLIVSILSVSSVFNKIVSTGRALTKQYCYLSLAATPGDHVLTITAPGYETWQKAITLLEGSKNGQNFLIELKKSAK